MHVLGFLNRAAFFWYFFFCFQTYCMNKHELHVKPWENILRNSHLEFDDLWSWLITSLFIIIYNEQFYCRRLNRHESISIGVFWSLQHSLCSCTGTYIWPHMLFQIKQRKGNVFWRSAIVQTWQAVTGIKQCPAVHTISSTRSLECTFISQQSVVHDTCRSAI